MQKKKMEKPRDSRANLSLHIYELAQRPHFEVAPIPVLCWRALEERA